MGSEDASGNSEAYWLRDAWDIFCIFPLKSLSPQPYQRKTHVTWVKVMFETNLRNEGEGLFPLP